MDIIDKFVDWFIIIVIIAIITLKIIGVITISWLWLLSPIWMAFLLGLCLTFAGLIVFTISTLQEKRRKRNEWY